MREPALSEVERNLLFSAPGTREPVLPHGGNANQ
jgi:hypothetical protein